MLLMDAARYWDVSPMDAVLSDERGAIWPDDAYVALELANAYAGARPEPPAGCSARSSRVRGRRRRRPLARIALRIKATAAIQDDEQAPHGGHTCHG